MRCGIKSRVDVCMERYGLNHDQAIEPLKQVAEDEEEAAEAAPEKHHPVAGPPPEEDATEERKRTTMLPTPGRGSG